MKSLKFKIDNCMIARKYYLDVYHHLGYWDNTINKKIRSINIGFIIGESIWGQVNNEKYQK